MKPVPNVFPHNLDDEKSVIGSIFINPQVIDEVASILRPEHFFDSMHASIFRLMMAYREDRKPIEIASLVPQLKAEFPTENVGAVVASAAKFPPHAGHAKFYAEQVRDNAKRRNWMKIANDILANAKDQSIDAAELDAKSDHSCRDGLDFAQTATSRVIGSGLDELAEKITSGHYAEREGLKTGLSTLDRITGGLRPGNLITLAAPTGGNKSGFTLSRLIEISQRTKKPTLLFCMEMTAEEIEERAMANLSNVPTSRFGNPTEDEKLKIKQAAEFYRDCPVHVIDKAMIRVTEIASIARAMHWQHDFAAIAVDYVQQVEPDRPKDPRHQQVGFVTRCLKTLAMDLRVPVIALAQLNREHKGGKPHLSMLRESGSIEQDSNMVWFLWTDAPPQQDNTKRYSWEKQQQQEEPPQNNNSITLTVAKHRSGMAGVDIPLVIKPGVFQFYEEAVARYSEREEFEGNAFKDYQ